ncbi:MAG: aldo/keto reductase [Planctomycetota bacterium]
MKKEDSQINRRNFLKAMGAAGFGSVLAASSSCGKSGEADEAKYPQVPRRRLGRTGVEVPIVGLGCKKHPELRKRLFLISKPVDLETPLPVIADFDKDLQESMERTKTDYFDVYCAVHGLSNPDQLTDELKRWAEDCKKRGLFKYLGYSAHENMAQGLFAAAKCGWIDVVLVAYNFQLMQDNEYQRAIDAARKADIGLIAIKTQRKATLEQLEIETEEDKKLTGHFMERGFTTGQAKLKVVLEDKRFASAAVGIRDIGILTQNVAAALDKTKLSWADRAALQEYARATCDMYCTGCSHICNAVVTDMPYVSHIMRYLMYYNSYGHEDRAKQLFARLPRKARNNLLNVDYTLAEARCPQHLPIGKIVAEAVTKLA